MPEINSGSYYRFTYKRFLPSIAVLYPSITVTLLDSDCKIGSLPYIFSKLIQMINMTKIPVML